RRLEHDPEKWLPVSRLREALGKPCRVARCFGGRRQGGRDHAPKKKRHDERIGHITTIARSLTDQAGGAPGGNAADVAAVRFTGDGALPAVFAVTDYASGAVATAALAIAELIRQLGGAAPAVAVDRRLASFWFGQSIRPIDWELPPLWDPIA